MDRCLGRRIAEPLRAAGVIVHLHDDHFPQNAEDQEWLTEVGKRGWVVLTKDQWIRRRVLERDALLAANLKVFCLIPGSIPFDDMAELIIKSLLAVRRIAESQKATFIAGIYRDATVRIIL